MPKGKHYELDMTKGAILPQLIRFSLPLIATSVLQLLYNAADVAVVGRFAGSEALAAVGSTGSLINLLTNLFIGLSLGGNVVIAHAHGAGDRDKVSRAVHTTVALSIVSGFLVMILGLIASRPMLQLMGSPEDVIDLAALYMRIFFIGMPFNMLYNFGAGILRAMGDTRRPLFYLSISGLVNVLLNLVLVIGFHMGVAGVAIATVASQVLSSAFILVYLLRTEECIHVDLKKLTLDKEYVKEILRVGLPAGIQSTVFNISNVTIQSTVNAQGSLVMAGNAAAGNLEGFAYVAMNALAQGALTFASTNRGARKYDRVRRILWVALAASAVSGLALGLLFSALGEPLLSIYNTNPEVIRWGMVRMTLIMPTYFLCGVMDVTACQMRGMGYSLLPMVVSLTGACAFRLVWIFTVYAAFPSMTVLYLSYPISWGITFIAHLICYLTVGRKKLSQMERQAA